MQMALPVAWRCMQSHCWLSPPVVVYCSVEKEVPVTWSWYLGSEGTNQGSVTCHLMQMAFIISYVCM